MNVVGKFGSYLSQSVYSVATPFHPFGGAVDIIVVQQQDGSFRSTPWYVRFGKFQGVLKGAEKIVRIEVNGVESDFHMYLDNSGEAYFIKEVSSRKDGEAGADLKDLNSVDGREDISVDYSNNDQNESSASHTGEVQFQDDHVENGDSDSERRFYEFQDEQSSLEGSLELSEYGSNRYENLDGMDHFVESQDPNSEVVLLSVDGQVLTAPITSSEEENTENLQLSTPQFHLGPVEAPDFCEEDTEFSSGEATWAADYLSDLKKSTTKAVSRNICNVKSGNNEFEHELEVCEGDGEHVSHVQETGVATLESELSVQSNMQDAPYNVKREDIFKSCLELHELGKNEEDGCREVEVQDSQEQPPSNSESPSGLTYPDLQVEPEATETTSLMTDQNVMNGAIVHSGSGDQKLDEGVGASNAAEGVESSLKMPASADECNISITEEPQLSSSNDYLKSDSRTRLEISLCGNELRAGMGLRAAAETFDKHRISMEDFKLSAASIIKNESLVVRFQDRYLTWDKAAHIVLGVAVYGLDLPIEPSDAIAVEKEETPKLMEDSEITRTPSGRRWRLWPIPFRRVKTLEHTSSNSSGEEVFVDSESGSQNQPAETTSTAGGGFGTGGESPHKQLVRTNVPTTEQIASLNLKDGQNMVSFIFSTRVLGVQKVDAHIYLWKWNARIVISDVDGTITKSDVLGQFMPLVGKDWTQSGVARLFCAIKENGYQLLFLSARAIVQAYLTRSFLLNLKQDGKALPNGPVVISPDGLFPSLFREVIRRAPHEFKIACLEDIKALFPSDYNPFYAGFGNRDTDELSYRKIGIPKGKIFIINPKGEVAISHRIDMKGKSYTSLHTLVNDMFPPTSMVEQEDYNQWNYWKVPLPDVEL